MHGPRNSYDQGKLKLRQLTLPLILTLVYGRGGQLIDCLAEEQRTTRYHQITGVDTIVARPNVNYLSETPYHAHRPSNEPALVRIGFYEDEAIPTVLNDCSRWQFEFSGWQWEFDRDSHGLTGLQIPIRIFDTSAHECGVLSGVDHSSDSAERTGERCTVSGRECDCPSDRLRKCLKEC